MSKADDLRKKMGSRTAAPTFTPRPSVNVQPLPATQTEEKPKVITPKPKTEEKKPAVSKKPKAQTVKDDELVVLFAKIPQDDKRWLDHLRIDEGKEQNELVREAIHLLKQSRNK